MTCGCGPSKPGRRRGAAGAEPRSPRQSEAGGLATAAGSLSRCDLLEQLGRAAAAGLWWPAARRCGSSPGRCSRCCGPGSRAHQAGCESCEPGCHQAAAACGPSPGAALSAAPERPDRAWPWLPGPHRRRARGARPRVGATGRSTPTCTGRCGHVLDPRVDGRSDAPSDRLSSASGRRARPPTATYSVGRSGLLTSASWAGWCG